MSEQTPEATPRTTPEAPLETMPEQEWSIRLQFLEEAQDYLNQLESNLLGLGQQKLEREALDCLLRAAHSTKGGAALMGFEPLSQIAHRLEDFFKVLQGGRYEPSSMLEQLFLNTVDQMQQMLKQLRQHRAIDPSWLAQNPQRLLDQLYEHLGDPTPEDEQAALRADAGGDMSAMLFESEIGPCLDRLESVLNNPKLPLLREEFLIACPEMGNLGEMLDLNAFTALCAHAEAIARACSDEQLTAVCRAILKVMRRGYGLVLVGQTALMPEQVPLPASLGDLLAGPVIADPFEIDDSENGSGLDHSGLDLELELDALAETLEPAQVDLFAQGEELNDTFAPESEAIPDADDAEAIDITESSDVEAIAQLADGVERAPDFAAEPNPAAPNRVAEIDTSALDSLMGDFVLEDLPLDTVSTKTSAIDSDAESQSQSESQFRAEFQSQPEAQSQAQSESISSPALETSVQPADDVSIRVSVRKLERLGELLGELTTERNGIGLQLDYLKTLFRLLNQRVKSLERANQLLRQSYDRGAVQTSSPSASASASVASIISAMPVAQMISGFDQLEMDQYSDLHLVSQDIIESVVQIQEVTTDIELALNETDSLSRELNRTAKQLQLGMNQVRMRPLSEITTRFPRMLRQLSLSCGKQVELQVRGGGTLIERSVIEALQDPLMHLVRNCFDHGIEPPDQRMAQGKSPKGTIEIYAGYRGNQVAITVQDDGSGIDLNKIRGKMLALGLSSEEIDASGQQALLNLIFEPGFSTADQVTKLSGRGVGMDVVRSNLRAVQGDITVDTVLGQGTTFTMAVPLSLSVTRVLVVECQNMMMAFPANIVEEMLLLEQYEVMQVAEQNLIEWQGHTIPLLHLKDWLQFSRPIIKAETENSPVIDQDAALVVTREAPYAIRCDRYWGEQEVTTRTVEGNIALPQGFSGCVVLGDGRIVPLVDIAKLVDRMLQGPVQQQSTVSLRLSQAVTDKPTVLVVDDSINVRRFLAVTLEKAGYNVEQAKDGQDAIEKLCDGITPNAVISDVEMPRLDGFGFLAQIKSLVHCEDIPVVMLTSRSGEKHRQLAFSLGAAQYFSKPFRQNELLKTLAGLLSESAAEQTAAPPTVLSAV